VGGSASPGTVVPAGRFADEYLFCLARSMSRASATARRKL
jgi:hypothetical protein